MGGGAEAHVARIVHLHLSGLAALGCDEDDTERSPRTVDRSRSGIFQYGDRLDVVRIQRVHIAFDTVDQNQRTVHRAIADGTRTANIDAHRGVQVAAIGAGSQVQARNGSLQSLRYVGHGTCFDGVGINHADSSRHVDFLLGAIPYHYYLIQQFRITFHLHVNRRASFYADILWLKPYIAESQYPIGRHIVQYIVPVRIGYCTFRRISFYYNRSTDNRFMAIIGYGTSHRNRLRRERKSRDTQNECKQASRSKKFFPFHAFLIDSLYN